MNNIQKPFNSTPGETKLQVASIALSAVPVVGGVLSNAANHYVSERKNKRLDNFLFELAADLESVKERINSAIINYDDLENLVEDIFSKVSESIYQEKIDAFRSILLNFVLSQGPNYDEAAEITELIHQWQHRHIILLKILSNPRTADKQMGNVVGDKVGFTTTIGRILKKLLPEWDDAQIERTWADLYKVGIVKSPDAKVGISDIGIKQLECRLTEFGNKIVSYLTNPVAH
jgi:hypothetical protein